MRYSVLFGKTLRQKPRNVKIKSHQLLLRAGFICPVSSGIYSFLPLGFRVLEKIDFIIKDELSKQGVQHLLMPLVHPVPLWKQTGRFDKMRSILAVFRSQSGAEYLLAPTHEETITDLARKYIKSYKDLPVILNQNQWKYRDEIRVSGGLLRTREFLMQDAYSFNKDEKGLNRSFQLVSKAYHSIFKRFGFEIVVVQADSGVIGGSGSKEFMLLSEAGEDTVVACDKCDYRANIETATSIFSVYPQDKKAKPMKSVFGKGLVGVEPLAKFLKIPVYQTTKTLLYQVDGAVVAVCIRGDYEVNETKLRNILKCTDLKLISEERIKELTGAKVGYAGPIGLAENIRLIWDQTTKGRVNFETGANKTSYHNINVNFGRDVDEPDVFYDVRHVKEEEKCADCKTGKLQKKSAIEVAHVFKLGTLYSKTMKAEFVDEDGKSKPIVMGCYGIGITRVLAAVVEQHHDGKGIVWPKNITPFEAYLISLAGAEKMAEEVYYRLQKEGVDVLWDDRQESAGVKFADADLIGIPIRLVISRKTKNKLEIKYRTKEKTEQVGFAKATSLIKDFYSRKE